MFQGLTRWVVSIWYQHHSSQAECKDPNTYGFNTLNVGTTHLCQWHYPHPTSHCLECLPLTATLIFVKTHSHLTLGQFTHATSLVFLMHSQQLGSKCTPDLPLLHTYPIAPLNLVNHLAHWMPTHCNWDSVNCCYAHPCFPEWRVLSLWRNN